MPAITFSGLASGIDSEAIIKTITDARRLATVPLQDKRDFNDKQSGALEEFNTKLLSLNDTLKGFLSLSGGGVSKRGTSSNSDAVSVAAQGGALTSSATITVQQLARAATFSFNDRFDSNVSPIAPGLSGQAAIELTIGTGDAAHTISVNVDSTTTLAGLADSINNAAQGKLQASTVNLGTDASPQNALLINGLETGTEKGILSVNVDGALTGQGIFGSSTIEQAQDAILTVSGIGQVTRPSNQIAGLLPGLTIQLKQANTGPIQIGVGDDSEKTSASVEAFVAALNDVISYSSANNKIERVENNNKVTNIFGSLAKSTIDNDAVSSIKAAISQTTSGIEGSSVQILADLGITIQRDGTYKFEKKTFDEAMSKDAFAAGKVLSNFADKVATTNGVIASYTKFQGQIELAIKSKDEENTSIADKLDRVEAQIEAQTASLRQVFAALEQKISKLNNGSAAISSIIAGLGK